jgi:signal peptidase II
MLKWVWVSIVVVLLDQLSKWMAVANLEERVPEAVMPHLNFTLAYNYGAAFSFLGDQDGWQRWFFTAIAVGVSVMLISWLYKLPRENKWLAVALTLILGGALGNLFDRLVYGHVIDFISVHWDGSYFPAFNIADSAITVGAIMLGLDVVFEARREKAAAQKSAGSLSKNESKDKV